MSEGTPLLAAASSESLETTTPSYLTLPDDLENVVRDESPVDAPPGTVEWKAVRIEGVTLFKLAWPVVGTYVVGFMNNIAPLLTLGHLSTKYLAAISLTTMTANITAYSIGSGLSTALDTLCSQAFTGSADRHALGRHLQRSIVTVFLLAIPIFTLWSFCEPILLALGQDPEVARLSGFFIKYLMPGLIPQLLYNSILRYLQAQGIMKASFYIMLLSVPVNIAMQYLFVHGALSIGPQGAPLATSLTYILDFICMVLYASYVRGYECWGGWEWREALDVKKIYIYLSLGLPGIIMVCSEWWAFELVALAAGVLGDTYLAAQTIILNTCALTYMFPMGMGIATSTRVGNCLGANLPFRARNAAIAGYSLGFVLASVNFATLLTIRNVWGYVYTADETVVQLVAEVLPIAALFQLNDGLGALGNGVFRGCGRQKLGGMLNLTAYYVLGLPLGALFTFHFKMGLEGIWLGLTTGIFIVSFSQLYINLMQTNWPEMAKKALQLVRTHSEPRDLVSDE
ncbi:hypothetical protein HDU91_005670 [Kappamyces sp. JEL0680]|nr:hypothetical protein HDU91_005670 [Kappamyces sp. JEL0680]